MPGSLYQLLAVLICLQDTLISIEEEDELTLQATPEPAEIDLFDPVKTCRTLGLRHFDSQNFISLQILQ